MHALRNSTSPWQDGSVQQVQLLLDAGSDLRATDDNGLTALMHGAMLGRDANAIQLLIDAGADLETTDNDHGMTPLLFAVSWERFEFQESSWSTEMVSKKILSLIDAGADVTATDNDGRTAWDLIQQNEGLRETEAYQRLDPATESD